MRTIKTLTATAILLILAACGNNSTTFPEIAIISVNPTEVTPGAEITVTGRNYYAVTGVGSTRIELCGVTLNGTLVEPLTSTILLPPGSTITAEVGNTITGTLPADDLTAGPSNVRVTRPDGSTAVLENAVTCVLPAPEAEPTPVTAVLNTSSTTGVAPATITFNASGSTGEGELEYTWNFGVEEAATAAGAEVTFEYQLAGTYTVTLTVTDGIEATGTAKQDVVIHPPLQAVIQHDEITSYAPVTVTFNATSSTGVAPLTYSWDFGDETGTSDQAKPTYEYQAAGTYTVKLTVTDAEGESSSTELDIVIPAPTPVVAVIAPSGTTGVAPATITFSSTGSTGEGALEYEWDFGDGNTSTQAQPSHTFTTPGTYTVTLTVTDETTTEKTATHVITIHPPLHAVIEHSPINTYAPITISFDATGSTGIAPLTYAWDFGDGATSTQVEPSHEFTAGGTYTVQLNVTDANNDTAKTQAELVIPAPTPVTAVLNTSATTGVAPATITFSSTGSTGEGELEYEWDFDDGNTSTQAEPSHTFTIPGNYTVELTVTDETTTEATVTQVITIHPPLQAVIEHSPVDTYAPITIRFDATGSTGIAPLTFAWDFGAGTTSTQAIADHEFTAGGTYTVQLTVTDANNDTSTTDVDLVIPSPTPVHAVMTPSATTGVAPATIIFSSTGSTGEGELVFEWDFGDGATSTQAEPSHTFATPRNYTVTLTVTDATTTEKTATQVITIHPPLLAVIQHSAVTGYASTTVSFDATGSTGIAPLTYVWDFGDGGTSTQAEPSHEFTTGGTYTVQLTVTDANNDTSTTDVTLVIPAPTPVQAVITPSATRGVAPATITFSSTGSTGEGELEYDWDFGDGATSDQAEPSNIFFTPGTYTVKLTVTDETTTEATATHVITIHPPLQAVIQHMGVTGYAPVTVPFDATNSTGIQPLTYAWEFGDGGTSDQPEPSHEFTVGGTYTVKLTVTDAEGLTNTAERDIFIPTAVNAVITPSATSGVAPATITFSSAGSTGEGELKYEWDFGDGGTSTLAEPSHTFTSGGTYTVQLTITDETNSTDTTTQTINLDLALATLSFEILPADLELTEGENVLVRGNGFNLFLDLPDAIVNLPPGDYRVVTRFEDVIETINGMEVESRWWGGDQWITLTEGEEHVATLNYTPETGILEFTQTGLPRPTDYSDSVTITALGTTLGVPADTSDLSSLVPGVYELTSANIEVHSGDPVNGTAFTTEYEPLESTVQLVINSDYYGDDTEHEFTYQVIPVSSLIVTASSGLPAGVPPAVTLMKPDLTLVPEPWADLTPGHYVLEYKAVDHVNVDGITLHDGSKVDAYERYEISIQTHDIYLSSGEDAVHGGTYALEHAILDVEISAPPDANTADVTITDASGAVHHFTESTDGWIQLDVPIGEYHVEFNDPHGYRSLASGRTPAGYNIVDESFAYGGVRNSFMVYVGYEAIPLQEVTINVTPSDLNVEDLEVWYADDSSLPAAAIINGTGPSHTVDLLPGAYTIHHDQPQTTTVTHTIDSEDYTVTMIYSLFGNTRFDVIEGTTTNPVDITFTADTGSLVVQIVNPPVDTTPTTELEVWNGATWQTVTDPDFDKLEPGVYRVTGSALTPGGFELTDRTGPIVVNSDDVFPVQLLFPESPSVTFNVIGAGERDVTVGIYNADNNRHYANWDPGDQPLQIASPGNYFATARTPLVEHTEGTETYNAYELTGRFDFTINSTDSGVMTINSPPLRPATGRFTIWGERLPGEHQLITKLERLNDGTWEEVTIDLSPNTFTLDPGVYRFAPVIVTINGANWTEVYTAGSPYLTFDLSSGHRVGFTMHYHVQPSPGVDFSSNTGLPEGVEPSFTLRTQSGHPISPSGIFMPGQYSIEYHPVDYENPEGLTIDGVNHTTYERYLPDTTGPITIYLSSNEATMLSPSYNLQPARYSLMVTAGDVAPGFEADVTFSGTNLPGGPLRLTGEDSTMDDIPFGKYCLDSIDTTDYVVTAQTPPEAPDNCIIVNRSLDYDGTQFGYPLYVRYDPRDMVVELNFPYNPDGHVSVSSGELYGAGRIAANTPLARIDFYLGYSDSTPDRRLGYVIFGSDVSSDSWSRIPASTEDLTAGTEVTLIAVVETKAGLTRTFESQPLPVIP